MIHLCFPVHVKSASPVFPLIAVPAALLGTILYVAGTYLAFSAKFATTEFTIFGYGFSSTAVGICMAFIGGALVILIFRRILACIDHPDSRPDASRVPRGD